MGLFDMKFLMASFVLFVVLSPGFLLHLPLPDEDGQVVNPLSGKTSLSAKLFHAVVFTVVFAGALKVMGARLTFN
tara:strand:- start:109 stop:333 length:225 start_codon:yes stop_codon:yes gene_type:complete